MKTRLIDKGWKCELLALARDSQTFWCICPFIKKSVITELLENEFEDLLFITRLNVEDMLQGVFDLESLRVILNKGGRIRVVKGLHSKLYLFGEKTSVITSANLTQSGLTISKEFGIISDDSIIFQESKDYFHKLWGQIGVDLSIEDIEKVEAILTEAKLTTYGTVKETLPDFGNKVTLDGPPNLPTSDAQDSIYNNTENSFVTFFGKSDDRLSLDKEVYKDIEESGSHWAATYHKRKRPRKPQDGDVMFIARMTKDPNDYRIYGVAFTMEHRIERDTASENEINRREWKSDYPHYIRLYKGTYVTGTLQNGVSLYEMMSELKHESFTSTQSNYDRDDGNTSPQKALMQKPGIKLTRKAHHWILQRLEQNFKQYGTISNTEIGLLDKPDKRSSD